VNTSALFRNMGVVDFRIARASGNNGRVRYVEMDPAKLNTTFGFDVGGVLDRLGEASLGTRRELLGDDGPAGDGLCVIFPFDNRELPALLWTLARGLSVTRSARSDSPIGEPRLVRRAPRADSLVLAR
jgi:hypothetical protein